MGPAEAGTRTLRLKIIWVWLRLVGTRYTGRLGFRFDGTECGLPARSGSD